MVATYLELFTNYVKEASKSTQRKIRKEHIIDMKKYYKSTEVSKIINEPVTTLVRWYNETPEYFGEVRKYGKRNPKRYTESQVKKFKVVKFYKQTSKEKIFKLLESKI